MVTTRRSSNNVNSVFESYATPTSDVAILERPIEEEIVTKVENVQQPAIKDLNEEAKERRKNLDRILNYDRYSEQMSAVVETLAPVIEEQKEEAPVSDDPFVAEIERLIVERKEAKAAKNFAEADRIRQYLLEKGIVLVDTREGTTWKKEG